MPISLSVAIPADYVEARVDLHRVAAHVMARKRLATTGRFGLRVTPGGFGTPLFGDPDGEEQLRVAGGALVHEYRDGDGPHTRVVPLAGASLREVAATVGVDLEPALSVGTDTPDLGDLDAPLAVSAAAVAVVADFLAIGAAALDRVVADLGPGATPIVAQLWPEHFDLGLDVGVGAQRVNLGASAGDGYHGEPYAYVGPWGPDRPGDPGYWNVGFGALLGYRDVVAAGDPVDRVVTFMTRGLDLLAA